jgi:hypothetical protein
MWKNESNHRGHGGDGSFSLDGIEINVRVTPLPLPTPILFSATYIVENPQNLPRTGR